MSSKELKTSLEKVLWASFGTTMNIELRRLLFWELHPHYRRDLIQAMQVFHSD